MSFKFEQNEIGYSEIDKVVFHANTAIADIFGNGFFIVYEHWKVSSWNKTAENLLGISANDMIEKIFGDNLRTLTGVNYTIIRPADVTDSI